MNKKLILFSVIYIVLLFSVVSVVSSVKTSENLSDKILRFHILANSDETYDQELKLKVRDDVLNYSNDLYNNCNSFKEAVNVTKDNINNINNVALKSVKNNGYNYNVHTCVTKEYFNTRVYDNFTLPAGIYDSLKVIIGNGEGHNWWCVVYPTVCLSGCIDDFDSCLTKEEKELILNDKYIVKFKIIELYENIILKLKKEA